VTPDHPLIRTWRGLAWEANARVARANRPMGRNTDPTRELDAVCHSVEQCDSELSLQCLDLLRERRLRHGESFGGTRLAREWQRA
jgi:hypothetical protein